MAPARGTGRKISATDHKAAESRRFAAGKRLSVNSDSRPEAAARTYRTHSGSIYDDSEDAELFGSVVDPTALFDEGEAAQVELGGGVSAQQQQADMEPTEAPPPLASIPSDVSDDGGASKVSVSSNEESKDSSPGPTDGAAPETKEKLQPGEVVVKVGGQDSSNRTKALWGKVRLAAFTASEPAQIQEKQMMLQRQESLKDPVKSFARRRSSSLILNPLAPSASSGKWEFVLDPLNSIWIVRNNQVQILAHLYTALFTPFEVSLLPATFWGPSDVLLVRWWLNRIIDLVFLVDMVITCLTPIKKSDSYKWERSNRRILENYLRGWFFPDFLALFPWDLINAAGFRLLRIVRLLRLIKILKSSKYVDQLQSKYDVTYLSMQLVKFVAIFVVSTHWMACAWCFVATTTRPEDDGRTWVDALAESKLSGDIFENSSANVYLAAFYFAIMTITSVGYGDIVPQNKAEYVVAITIQAFGSITFTYLMAMFLSLVSVVDEEPWLHARRMDTLNTMMTRAKLSPEVRTNMRTFFIQARQSISRVHDRDVFDLMSPALQAQLVKNQFGPTLRKIIYFKYVTTEFLVEVCKAIKPLLLGPKEVLNRPSTLYVLDKGLLAHQGRMLGAGAFIGGDFMLSNPELLVGAANGSTHPTVLTFVELLTLHKLELEEVMMRFPKDSQMVRRGVVWTALKQYLLRVGRASLVRKGQRKSSYFQGLDHHARLEKARMLLERDIGVMDSMEQQLDRGRNNSSRKRSKNFLGEGLVHSSVGGSFGSGEGSCTPPSCSTPKLLADADHRQGSSSSSSRNSGFFSHSHHPKSSGGHHHLSSLSPSAMMTAGLSGVVGGFRGRPHSLTASALAAPSSSSSTSSFSGGACQQPLGGNGKSMSHPAPAAAAREAAATAASELAAASSAPPSASSSGDAGDAAAAAPALEITSDGNLRVHGVLSQSSSPGPLTPPPATSSIISGSHHLKGEAGGFMGGSGGGGGGGCGGFGRPLSASRARSRNLSTSAVGSSFGFGLGGGGGGGGGGGNLGRPPSKATVLVDSMAQLSEDNEELKTRLQRTEAKLEALCRALVPDYVFDELAENDSDVASSEPSQFLGLPDDAAAVTLEPQLAAAAAAAAATPPSSTLTEQQSGGRDQLSRRTSSQPLAGVSEGSAYEEANSPLRPGEPPLDSGGGDGDGGGSGAVRPLPALIVPGNRSPKGANSGGGFSPSRREQQQKEGEQAAANKEEEEELKSDEQFESASAIGLADGATSTHQATKFSNRLPGREVRKTCTDDTE